jgi:hypothetical protein
MNTNQTVVQMTSTLEMVGFIKTNGTACRFVSLVSNTPVTKIRKDCPFTGITKVSKKIGIINANYNTSVRKRIADKLGVELSNVEYENGEVWYRHLLTSDGKPLPLVEHKKKENGEYYLQYFPHKSSHKYLDSNGQELNEALLEPYFYKQSEKSCFKPTVICINLSNILQLKASGVVIEMPDFEEAAAVLAD